MSVVATKMAVVFDCDDTLAPDTTTWLLNEMGADPDAVYADAARLIKDDGWDPPLAYLNEILRRVTSDGELSDFTRDRIRELAQQVPFYPGTQDLFERLQSAIVEEENLTEIGITVSCFIVSGGIEELLADTEVGKKADAVWGSSFAYGEDGRPTAVKNSVSFTEKTRYLFCVNKGLFGQARTEPYTVNCVVDHRPVPFTNMIYVGDGPSDVPCMSLIERFGGTVIGMLHKEPHIKRSWEIGFGRRAHLTIPPDFGEESYGYHALKYRVLELAKRIRRDWELSFSPAPKY